MPKQKWTKELILELLLKWTHEHHHPRFDAKTFFEKNGLKVVRAKDEFAFTITRPDITAGVCGDVASCAGVLSVERDNLNVLKAFFFKHRAYLVMDTGLVMVRDIPSTFHKWILDFDNILKMKKNIEKNMKGQSQEDIERAKKSIEMLSKAELREGHFKLVPYTERKPMTGKALKARRDRMKKKGSESGPHASFDRSSAYRSLTVSKLSTAAVS